MIQYIALLRGVNVGKTKWVNMKEVKALFENLGFENVSTYINSGNILFGTDQKPDSLRLTIETALKKRFRYNIKVLVKTQKEMRTIAKAIPELWQNDKDQRTDVAYLFKEIDSKKTLDELPVKREFIDLRYVKGAVIWHFLRINYNKCRLNKLISHKLYKYMTVRNVNTARKLAGGE